MEPDTINKFCVAAMGNNIILMNSPLRNQQISKEDALNLAAYLVSMVGDDPEWERMLAAVQST